MMDERQAVYDCDGVEKTIIIYREENENENQIKGYVVDIFSYVYSYTYESCYSKGGC